MKRMTAIFLILAAMLIPVYVSAADSEADILNLLSEFKIMQGDGDGNYRLDAEVSRAEFTKMAVAASSNKNTVALSLKISPFNDVPYTHWSAPYVKAGVSAGYVKGYIDATFHPDDTVSYEEAVTILLRILGYSEEDFGVSWPYGQIGLADNLGMTDNVNANVGETLTRRQVANLVYNALNIKMKNSTQKLASVFDCEVIDDVDIIATSEEDGSLGGNDVQTSAGTYEKGQNFNGTSVGKSGTIFIKNNKEAVAFVADGGIENDGYDTYFVYSVLSDVTSPDDASHLSATSIIGYRDGGFENIDIRNAKLYGASSASELVLGDTLYVKRRNDGSIEYIQVDSNNFSGPVKVVSSSWIGEVGANSASKVFRNGAKSDISSVAVNDIVYYSEPLDIVFAYVDKVIGVYEAAEPNKDTPSKVRISGQTYGIEGVEAFYELSSNGSVKYGDTVTALLGRTGKIAGIVTSNSTSSAVGYITEAGRKNYTNASDNQYSSFYIRIVSADGVINEYETSSDYSAHIGEVYRVNFKDGKASLLKQSPGAVSGTVDGNGYMIGKTKIANNVKILDTLISDLYSSALYKSIYPQRLDGLNITASNVLYCAKNASGEITEMILKNVTGDMYSYGTVISRSKSDFGYLYSIDVNGQQMSCSSIVEIATGVGCKFVINNGVIEKVDKLGSYSGGISKLTNTEAIIGKQSYKLSDRVLVYRKRGSVQQIPLDEAINGSYRLTAYYDKLESTGGRIRVIIAE